jgi:hypothetical protein
VVDLSDSLPDQLSDLLEKISLSRFRKESKLASLAATNISARTPVWRQKKKPEQVVVESDPQHLDPNPLSAGASASNKLRPQKDDSTPLLDTRRQQPPCTGSRADDTSSGISAQPPSSDKQSSPDACYCGVSVLVSCCHCL